MQARVASRAPQRAPADASDDAPVGVVPQFESHATPVPADRSDRQRKRISGSRPWTESRRRRIPFFLGECAMNLWLNVADAAEHAGVCRDTIYTAVERGELRHVRIGGRRSIRVKAQWLDEWLERHTRAASAASPSDRQADVGA